VNSLIKEDLFNIAKPSKTEIDLNPIVERHELLLTEILIANDALNKNDRDSEEIKKDISEIKYNYQSVEKAVLQLQAQNIQTIELLNKNITENTNNINKLCRVLANLQKK
jgi:predicted RNase H-like nuclease (RuvC/YqgF family)